MRPPGHWYSVALNKDDAFAAARRSARRRDGPEMVHVGHGPGQDCTEDCLGVLR